MDYVQRKSPAHPPVVQRQDRSTIVFVTVCTEDRAPLLANDVAHQLLLEVWSEAHLWLVGRYVIMPDHIHLFCSPNGDVPVKRWASFWKYLLASRWPATRGGKLLQRDSWDTQMRTSQMYSEKGDYVLNNPVRVGLCATPEEWPFQGEIHRLEWHGK